MRILNYTTFFLLCLLLLACSQPNEETGVINVVSSSFIVEEVEPPQPGYRVAKFNSIEEWLTNICGSKKPNAVIDAFCIGLFESEEYHLFLVGKKDSVAGNDHYSKVSFEPAFMYYKLPEREYASLPRQEMLTKISSELKEFLSSNKFKDCFLLGAKSFITEYNGENLLLQ